MTSATPSQEEVRQLAELCFASRLLGPEKMFCALVIAVRTITLIGRREVPAPPPDLDLVTGVAYMLSMVADAEPEQDGAATMSADKPEGATIQ